MTRQLKSILKSILFFGTGFIVLYLVYHKQNKAFQADCAIKCIPESECSLLAKVGYDISHAHFVWVLIPMALFMLTNVIRALRWKMMFEAIGYQPRFINLLATIMVNYLANLGIPRSGEIIRAGLISQYEDIPVEKSLGTIFTDRIFDVIMLAGVIVLTLMVGGSDLKTYFDQNMDLSARFGWFTSHPWQTAGMAIFFSVIIAFMYLNRKRLYATSAGKKILHLAAGFAEGVKSVLRVRHLWLFISYTVLIWIIYYFMLWGAFRSFDPVAHLGPIAGLVVFTFGSLGILFPSPGGMGSYHFLVGEALAMYGISGSDAFSFANIVFFSIQLFVVLIFGIVSLVALPVINSDKS
jgi:uncharacterized protein (TIRG00374 family)